MSKEDEYIAILGGTILDYMQLGMNPRKSDAIIGFGVLDTRVAEKSAELFLEGFSDKLIFTGGYGRITSKTNHETEARIFKSIAVKMGVPKKNIFLEEKASNTGENLRFSEKLINDLGLKQDRLIFVTKPYMERRVYAAACRQWSNKSTEIILSSPDLSFKEHISKTISKDLFINIMVGDLQRIKEYPKQGFQIEQKIPKKVWEAYLELVKMGYDKQLIK